MGTVESGRDRSGESFLDYYLVVLLICTPLCTFLAWQSLSRVPARPPAMDQVIDLQLLLRNLDRTTLIGYDQQASGRLSPIFQSPSLPAPNDLRAVQQSSAQPLELDELQNRSVRIRF
jgi:hypothetical protein